MQRVILFSGRVQSTSREINHRKCQKAHSGIVSVHQGPGQTRTLAHRQYKKRFTKEYTRGGAPLREPSLSIHCSLTWSCPVLLSVNFLTCPQNKKREMASCHFPQSLIYFPTLALSKSGSRVEVPTFLSACLQAPPMQFTCSNIPTLPRKVNSFSSTRLLWPHIPPGW